MKPWIEHQRARDRDPSSADMAEIVPGIAIYAFGLLIPVLAGAASFLDAEIVWREIGHDRAMHVDTEGAS